MQAALAALPIGVIVYLMLVPRWPAAKAGSVGLVLALVLAWTAFPLGRTEAVDTGPALATLGALAEALFTAGTILWIVFAALCLYHLQTRTGSIDVLRSAISGLTPDVRLVTILVAWFFGLFMEGAAGFGTSAALAAPLLVSFGYRPVDAVAIALLGHAVGVSFGAVGTPIIPQVAASGLDASEISWATGVYHAVLGWTMLVAVVLLASRAIEGARTKGAVWPWTLLAAVCFLVPFAAIARWVGPELPTLAGAIIGMALFAAVLALRRGQASTEEAGRTRVTGAALLRALSPYLIVIALILTTRLISPVQDALQSVVVSWTLFEGFRGSFQPLYHPGTMLFLGFALGALIQRTHSDDILAAASQSLRRLAPVAVALVAMLGLARVMVHGEMVVALAETSGALAGGAWPLLAPFVGVLGTFVTGSATASNILFTDFQLSTADQLALPQDTMLGAQGFGAAAGNVICPHNIIAGGATVGLGGREGDVLRLTALPCLAYALLGGLMAILLT